MANINIQNGFILGSLIKSLYEEKHNLNINFGLTEPSDKNGLWVKTPMPSNIKIVSNNSPLNTNFTSQGVYSFNRPFSESGYCVVGDKIYIIGGIDSNSQIVSDIYVYNITTKNLDKLDNSLPYGICSIQPVFYNDYIYIFGGKTSTNNTGTSKIIKINTKDDTVSIAGDNIRYSIYYNAIKVIDKYAYIIGGKDNGVYGYSLIRRYNLDTETLDENSVSLPSRGYSFGLSSAQEGSKNVLYVFSGKTNGSSINSLVKIIIDENSFSNSVVLTLSSSAASDLGESSAFQRVFTIDNDIYVLNNVNGNIYVLNKMLNTFNLIQKISLLVNDNNIFLIDEKDKNNFYIISNSIFHLKAKKESVSTNELIFVIDANIKSFIKIIEATDLDISLPIAGVYLGNNNNVGIREKAYIYNFDKKNWNSI